MTRNVDDDEDNDDETMMILPRREGSYS